MLASFLCIPLCLIVEELELHGSISFLKIPKKGGGEFKIKWHYGTLWKFSLKTGGCELNGQGEEQILRSLVSLIFTTSKLTNKQLKKVLNEIQC